MYLLLIHNEKPVIAPHSNLPRAQPARNMAQDCETLGRSQDN